MKTYSDCGIVKFVLFVLMCTTLIANGSHFEIEKISNFINKEETKSPACCVCQENFIATLQSNCGHIFCPNCAQTILNQEVEKCPTCDDALPNNFFDYIPTISPLTSKMKITTKQLQLSIPILCAKSNLEMLKKWLEPRPDLNVNARGFCGVYPIHVSNSKEISEYLVKKGAKIDQPSLFRGTTALWLNSAQNSLEQVKFLIEHGANINAESSDGISAISIAAHKGHLTMVKYLAERGANLENTLVASCETGHLEMVKYLIFEENQDINQVNHMGVTPLIAACTQGHEKIVKFLLKNGADINQPNFDGETPLWVSCEVSNLDLMRFLIHSGAQIDKPDNFGITPLALGIMKKNIKFAVFLLKNDASVEQANYFFTKNGYINQWNRLEILNNYMRIRKID